MDVFVNLLINSKIDPKQAWVLGLLLLFLPIFFFAHWAVKRGMQITLRPISGYTALKGMLARAAEAGQPVHLSLGTTGIGESTFGCCMNRGSDSDSVSRLGVS